MSDEKKPDDPNRIIEFEPLPGVKMRMPASMVKPEMGGTPNTPLDEILELVDKLLPRMDRKARTDLMYELSERFCKYCGGDNPRCPCENDE